MMPATRIPAALRRMLVVPALVALAVTSAGAQQPVDTLKKPATKTTAPPATKTAAPPTTKTVAPAATKAVAPTTKTVVPPPSKTVAKPPAKAVTTPATKTVPQQAASKTAAPVNKSAAPPPVTKPVTTAPLQTVAQPNKPITLPPSSKPADKGIIAKLKRMLGLGDKPAPAPAQTKKVAAPATKTATPPATPPTKSAANQAPATGAKSAAKTASKPTAPAKTAAVTPQPKAPAQTKTNAPAVTPPQTKTAAPVTAPTPGVRRLDVVTGDTALARPLVIMREVFTYDPAGRRDPFVSLLTTNDLRPTLSDLRLMGTVVDEPGRSVALLLDNSQTRADKKQVSVRVGSRLGRMRVASIRPNVVVFTITEFGMNRIDSLLLRDSTKARGR